ncbi:CLUMA_CG005273, isoform A [Clunio marinus]|uniref:CLUMA_CG005273, isoform A n=1 Tax=Clunio marinus TaxID=568069 RepID=A0A1J1HUE0_9DIPT|nr:CLUMA_CG005273, isoform A [Clunio marinus]
MCGAIEAEPNEYLIMNFPLERTFSYLLYVKIFLEQSTKASSIIYVDDVMMMIKRSISILDIGRKKLSRKHKYNIRKSTTKPLMFVVAKFPLSLLQKLIQKLFTLRRKRKISDVFVFAAVTYAVSIMRWVF